MTEDIVLRADHGPVTVLTLNRPERRNAWTIGLQRRYAANPVGTGTSRVAP